ncbi:hypothetical protein J5277_13585 [Rhizobium sp. 16-449-1b]|uniref:hypothetical protein n=1 Tax=Rhizobium sp. 16-449-1b TaxID=2819989 RepID=UPI001ADB0FE1|nr:hypothetical protein [Rhizobium sp. 16-449-1b]MBO9195137.1 hypothetical protein [Rhizobium sp. 16-449-1b]
MHSLRSLAVIAGSLREQLEIDLRLRFDIHLPDRQSVIVREHKLTFEEFVSAGPRMRNKWVREPGISIYIRKPTGFGHNADYELASMEADVPGSGSLTSFLERYEPTTVSTSRTFCTNNWCRFSRGGATGLSVRTEAILTSA